MPVSFHVELSAEDVARLVELRGGCACHVRPPCFNCSEPVTQEELELLGIEVEPPAASEVDYVAITRSLCR